MLDCQELLERAHVVSLPMRVRFRGITTREALLIEGPQGWGEFSPFLEYSDEEALPWLRSALEMALSGPPQANRERIAVNATVPAIQAEQVPEVLARFAGCTTVKVKVAEPGQSLLEDVARVQAVRDAIPGARIRVDANGGWSVAEALEAAQTLGPLDYMEQPCRTTSELAELRQQCIRRGLFVRIAADESIRKATDPYEIIAQQAADVAVVKAPPMGGPRAIVQLAQHMRAKGLDITVSSALDTAVGMNAGISAVAALPAHTDDEDFDVPPAAAGLATQRLFLEDVAPERLLIDGHLEVRMLSPEPDRLSSLAAPAARKDHWFARFERTYQLLQQVDSQS